MADIIHELEQKLIVSAQDAENMHADFDNIQLSIFRDTKNNTTCTPTGRIYSDIVKEFAATLNYYSPKAYLLCSFNPVITSSEFNPQVVQSSQM